MKKTKVIVPALALIAFSTVASIAGSVAWFTASRQVTINAGSYAVVKTNSDLQYALTNGVGTSFSSNTVSFDGKLTDGSFNHKTGNVYTPNTSGTGIAKATSIVGAAADLTTTELENIEADLLRTTLSGDVKVYTAATFDISFTVNFGVGELDKGLYLNCTSGQSQFTHSDTAKTAKGFRMAFYPVSIPDGSAASAKVFADLQESANCKYVAGNDNIDGTAYGANELIDVNHSTALPTASTDRAVAIARPDYLGTFKASETNPLVTLKYRVVVWFEGTDPEIINRDTQAEYQEVTSKLVFEAVDLKAA